MERPTAESLPLSLDDAISLGLERNVQLKYQRANQRVVKGDELGVINALLPALSVRGAVQTQEINLAALGFKPASLGPLLQQFGLAPGSFQTIVKVTTLQGLISAKQDLFDLPAYELYLGSKTEARVVNLNNGVSRGNLILAVGSSYLKVLADQSNVANTRAEERAAYTLFRQAVDRRDAGVGTNLDALRGQVDYQQRQQNTISAETALARDTIQLNRLMGLPAGQQLDLTDAAPFNTLANIDLAHALQTAYVRRQDLLSLHAQVEVDDRELHAVRYQRLPTLAFNGYYGVIGATGGLYHGVFTAEGSLRFPIFHEAEQRGQEEAVEAQLNGLRDRERSLRVTVDEQIRASMLDVSADRELVKVAQSNVDLAQQELSDERQRFAAGVDTNLPVVDAEASVTGAQAQLVNALYQYNLAKLGLARSIGIIETRYREFVGPLTAASAAPSSAAPTGASSATPAPPSTLPSPVATPAPVLGKPAPVTVPAPVIDPNAPIVAPNDPFLPPSVPSQSAPVEPLPGSTPPAPSAPQPSSTPQTTASSPSL